jgi:uncharacterized membrane protein YidH (DUF202 family)
MSLGKTLVGLVFNLAVFCVGSYLRSGSQNQRRKSIGKLLQMLSVLALILFIVAAALTHFLLNGSSNLF